MSLFKKSMNNSIRARSELSTNFFYDDAEEKIYVQKTQDVESIINSNREKQRLDDGYTKDRSLRRVGRDPLVIVEKIISEEGWNPMLPENSDRLLQLLDRPEYAYLKTSEGTHSRKKARTYYKGSASTKLVYDAE